MAASSATTIRAIFISRDETANKLMASTLPQNHQAVVVTHFDQPLALIEVPVPPLVLPFHILVRNYVVGVNPVDWKSKKYRFAIYDFPWINGRELCGQVVRAGAKLVVEHGEMVIVLLTSYRELVTLTFQEFTVIDLRLVWKLPPHLTPDSGATLGVGLTTAGIILYQAFEFGFDESIQNKTILIYGGSTVTGLYLTQLAKTHGLTVVSVASKVHETYLTELGSDHLINRHAQDYERIVRSYKVDYAVDCVLKQTASQLVDWTSLSTKVAGIVGVPDHPKIQPVIIKLFHENIDFGVEFISHTQKLLNVGRLVPVRPRVFKGGLPELERVLQVLEAEGASAEKFIVSLVK